MSGAATRTVLIAALGGQGGGVLCDWIAHAARAMGRCVQATSTPGVSQRTGSTTYYLEIANAPPPGAVAPVLGLMPLPGRVDVLVCAELLEAARMLERGMSTPLRTTVIASTHRVFATREKITGHDGRYDSQRVCDAARALSRQAVLFDMDALRLQHGAAISAVLFGALAGSGALGLGREQCERAIRAAGVGVAQSLAAFGQAWHVAAAGDATTRPHATVGAAESNGIATVDPAAAGLADVSFPLPAPLAMRTQALPQPVADIARLGAVQTCAYQDEAYGALYLERVERIASAEVNARPDRARDGSNHAVAREAARCLALWMCYDDLIRVAALKARTSRLHRIRGEVRAGDAEVVRVFDFFKPGAPEIAAILPPGLGLALERWAAKRGEPTRAGKGIKLQSSSLSGALLLRTLSALRPLRPRSLRFAREQRAIDEWITLLLKALADTRAGAALEVARLPRLLKGYGQTHEAGQLAFKHGASAVDQDAHTLNAGDAPKQPRPVFWMSPR